jgi:hypothetical protein
MVNTFQEDLLYAHVDGIVIEDELLFDGNRMHWTDLYFNLSANSLDNLLQLNKINSLNLFFKTKISLMKVYTKLAIKALQPFWRYTVRPCA